MYFKPNVLVYKAELKFGWNSDFANIESPFENWKVEYK